MLTACGNGSFEKARHYAIRLIAITVAAVSSQVANGQWVQIGSLTQSVTGLGSFGSNLYAGVNFGGTYRSTDNGATWAYQIDGLPYENYFQNHFFYPTVYCFSQSGSTLFAGTFKGFFVSTDAGVHWTKRSTGITSEAIKAIVNMGTVVCAGSDGGGVFVSTNGGESWASYNSGLTTGTIRALVQKGSDLYAGTYGYYIAGVFRSTDQGVSWTRTSEGLGTATTVNCLAVSGTTLIAGTDGSGVYVSTDNGGSWKAATNGITDPFIRSLVAYGNNIFVGTNGGGFYSSTDMGASWTQHNEGLTRTFVYALMIVGEHLYAGTQPPLNGSGGYVFRRPLTDLVSAVEGPAANVPASAVLLQNYPNPFNPTTTIRYGIPARAHVTLTVYDALGQQVALIQDGEQDAGYHEVGWDGTRLSSGMYVYRMQAGSAVVSRSLLLLR